jgi:hypothetical protein
MLTAVRNEGYREALIWSVGPTTQGRKLFGAMMAHTDNRMHELLTYWEFGYNISPLQWFWRKFWRGKRLGRFNYDLGIGCIMVKQRL